LQPQKIFLATDLSTQQLAIKNGSGFRIINNELNAPYIMTKVTIKILEIEYTIMLAIKFKPKVGAKLPKQLIKAADILL